MKVILLKDIPKVGKKNEVIGVADGYALNYLIPKKLAETATEGKIRQIERQKEQKQAKEQVQRELLEKELEDLKDAEISISAKVNRQGHLFKGINANGVVKALGEQGYANIGAEKIVLEKPIKEVGEFQIPVETEDKRVEFKLNITPVEQ